MRGALTLAREPPIMMRIGLQTSQATASALRTRSLASSLPLLPSHLLLTHETWAPAFLVARSKATVNVSVRPQKSLLPRRARTRLQTLPPDQQPQQQGRVLVLVQVLHLGRMG